MSFRLTYQAIVDMVENSVLDTELARAILRKSGFMPGIGTTLAETQGPRTILVVSPVGQGPVPAGTHAYPVIPPVWTSAAADVFHHVTRWDVSLASECKTSIAVASASGAGASLQAVWALTYADILSGASMPLCSAVAVPARGFYQSAWLAIPADALAAGDIYISFVLTASTPVTLSMGSVSLQIR